MNKDKYKLNLEIVADSQESIIDALSEAMLEFGDGNMSADRTCKFGPDREAAYSYSTKHGSPDRLLKIVRGYYGEGANAKHGVALAQTLEKTTLNGVQVPEHLWDGLVNYVVTGRRPGDFLTACLENNFGEAVAQADSKSLEGMGTIHVWLYNQVPSDCHGSYDAMEAWIEAHEAVREERR